MRVSLHCQGCAGKVKKHLSKMEGSLEVIHSTLYTLLEIKSQSQVYWAIFLFLWDKEQLQRL